MADDPKEKGAASLVAFLPAFEGGEFSSALECYLKSGEDMPLVRELEAAVYTSGFLFPFDWSHWEEGRAMAAEAIDRADLTTLRKLMTAFVRNNRFCGGAFAKRCVDGSVHRVLNRLNAVATSNR